MDYMLKDLQQPMCPSNFSFLARVEDKTAERIKDILFYLLEAHCPHSFFPPFFSILDSFYSSICYLSMLHTNLNSHLTRQCLRFIAST